MKESMGYVLDLALILLSTKVLGIISKQFRLPQVVGAIMGGLILGPAVLNVISETTFIHDISKLGVIVLMFGAGLHTDIRAFKQTGKASFAIAVVGVLVPLVGGYLLTALFNHFGLINIQDASAPVYLQNIFIGVILTATSVSITVEALKEMGKLNSKVGNTILGAAIIDDILGIIVLTIVISLKSATVHPAIVVLKMLFFFVFAGLFSYGFNRLFNKYQSYFNGDMRRFVIFSIVYCLILAYVAENYFDVADITGAFIAGLSIAETRRREYISKRVEVLSFALLSPMFFASIGLKVYLPSMDIIVVLFCVLFIAVAIFTKIFGCGLMSRLFGFSRTESFQIGCGMMTRGEVALIIANKGAALGLMSRVFFGPVVLMVVVTAILTPILLKLAFKDREDTQAPSPTYAVTNNH